VEAVIDEDEDVLGVDHFIHGCERRRLCIAID
jgi:hypothetical protein